VIVVHVEGHDRAVVLGAHVADHHRWRRVIHFERHAVEFADERGPGRI
jgi:hypothetical protein